MPIQYVWLVWSLLGLVIWFFIFISNRNLRKEMLWASLCTAPLMKYMAARCISHPGWHKERFPDI